MAASTKKEEATFTKEQILSSKLFTDRRDIVSILLNDNELYTIDQVNTHISKYMKGKVK